MTNYKTLVFGSFLSISLITNAQADERYRPIDDQIVKKECGACHMAFQADMLPKRSWHKIMDTLDSHFGEDASLSAEQAQHIRDYLVNNAADAGWWTGKMMRGIREDQTPLRISELPYWVREHGKEVPPWAWSDPKIKSKANCLACHQGAERGYYDDD